MNLQREIEKIKSTMGHISQMVQRACSGNKGEGSSFDSAFADEYGEYSKQGWGKYNKLGAMILRLQDGELGQKETVRMEKWLLADQHALKYYLEFNQLCSMLREVMGGKPEKDNIENALGV